MDHGTRRDTLEPPHVGECQKALLEAQAAAAGQHSRPQTVVDQIFASVAVYVAPIIATELNVFFEAEQAIQSLY